MKPTGITFATLPTKYADLVSLHPPRVIRDEVEYENTVEIVDALAGHRLTRDQEDYLQTLGQIVEAYENEKLAAPKAASGLDALRFLMEQHSMRGEDLAAVLNVDRSTAFKILKGSRKFTLEHVRRLSDRFCVSADLFTAA